MTLNLNMLVWTLLPIMLTCGIIQSVIYPETSLADRVSQQCNSRCQCVVSEPNVIVHCEKLNLDYVQDHLPKETTHFYFSYNQLKKLKKSTFRETHTPNLHTLDISHCNISTIDEDTFKKVIFKGSLAKLDLANNNVSDTKQLISVIKSLPKLEYIDLRNNTGVHCLKIINYFKIISNVFINCDKSSTIETTSPTDYHTVPRNTDLLNGSTSESEVTTASAVPEETRPHQVESVSPPKTTPNPNDSDSVSSSFLTYFGVGLGVLVLVTVVVLTMIYKQKIAHLIDKATRFLVPR